MATPYLGPLSTVHRDSEDGELKEVIFGRIDDFRLPDYDPIYDFVGPALVGLMKESGGKLFSEADPGWYGPVHEQNETVVRFLEDQGVVVHRPRDHTPDENARHPTAR